MSEQDYQVNSISLRFPTPCVHPAERKRRREGLTTMTSLTPSYRDGADSVGEFLYLGSQWLDGGGRAYVL